MTDPELDVVIRAGVISGAIVVLLTPVVRRMALRTRLVDVENQRSSHVGVVPRGGGIAVLVGCVIGVLASGIDTRQAVSLLCAACAFGVLGLVDDRFGLGIRSRLVSQLIIAAGFTGLLISQNWALSLTSAAGLLIGTLGVAGFVNAFNFMDGINGISCAQAIAGGVFFVVVGFVRDSPEIAIAGAALVAGFVGFLPYNAPAARIFLGDVGSYFAGCWLAGLAAISVMQGLPVEIAVLPGLYYVADTVLTIAIRTRQRHPIGLAHRDHAYQRLARAWKSHSRVSGAVFVVVASSSALGLAARDAPPVGRVAAVATAGAIAIAFFCFARSAETRSV